MATCRSVCQALVRNIEREDNVIISFIFNSKLHKLCRPKSQTLEKTLQRVGLTLTKNDKKRKGKQFSSSSLPPLAVSLLDENGTESIPLDFTNDRAWRANTWFLIGEQRYKVLVNYPQIMKLQVPEVVIAGCPIIPQVEGEFADKDHYKWEWLRTLDQSLISDVIFNIEMTSIDGYSLPNQSIEQIHEGLIYWPTHNDIGHQLIIQCTPNSNERQITGNRVYCQTSPVKKNLPMLAIHNRHKQTPYFLSPDYVRVVCYNILADQHSTTDYSSQVLYPYCNPLALQSSYRHSLLITELIGYHPDIVCLQEVAAKCYDFLLCVMKEKGFDGHFAQKTGQLQEGEAIFFNLSKYELMKSYSISLKHYIQSASSCKPLFKALESGAPSVLKNFLLRPTIIQLILLKVKGFENQYLLVSNTHLCFHPTEDYLRLMQAIVCTKAMSDIIIEFKESMKEEVNVGVIFCGDFNSCPCTGGYEYLTSGFLSKCHPDWTKYKLDLIPRCGCCKTPSNDVEYIVNTRKVVIEPGVEVNDDELYVEESIQQTSSFSHQDEFNGLDVSHEFKFQDACGPLEYTHYRDVFVAVLDYILIDKTCLEVERIIPMPSHEEVIEHVALPSVSFPSDHLALICDLKWKM